MTKVVKVTRAQARAARLRVRSDKERGITPDPRMERIANATVRPATVNGSASVGDVTVGGDAERDDSQVSGAWVPSGYITDNRDDAGEPPERVVYGSEARPTLSSRDQTVLRMALRGYSIEEVAEVVGVSEQEVEAIVGAYQEGIQITNAPEPTSVEKGEWLRPDATPESGRHGKA